MLHARRALLGSFRSAAALTRKPHAGLINVRAVGVLSGQADIIFNRILARCSEVANVDAGRARMVDGSLNGRVTHDKIPANLIARNAGRQVDPVCVAHDHIVNDDVVVPVQHSDTETEILGPDVAISTEPVRTEPVATCGTGQSYAAALGVDVSISNRNVRLDVVVCGCCAGEEDS